MKESQKIDVAIVGAGPAGCSAALSLRDANCSVALFDKAQFPRTKICGDGLCDRTINTLKAISPAYLEEFLSTQDSLCVKNTELYYKGRPYVVDFKNFGYICKRHDFDAFLFSLVQRDCKNVLVFQKCGIQSITRSANGMQLVDEYGEKFEAKMVLVCNGAASKLARNLTGNTYDKDSMGVAIRAYYSGVLGLKPGTMELHYKKEYFPGYLWIFPLADGTANVGFGCKVPHNNEERETLQNMFDQWISSDEALKARFAQAQRLSLIQGGLVPYNTGDFSCFGDNFCVCGDAANLIDPISGGGIGSAMLSGRFAALVAAECVNKGDYSKQATELYAQNLRKRVEKEMKTRGFLQRTISRHPWLLDVLAFAGKQSRIFAKIKTWYLG